jgi:hypothetical protein
VNLAVALPLGLASAIAYGAAAAVQHDAVGQGPEGSRPLRDLVRDARWWSSIAGDGVGLVLQLGALAFGPVVLVQPLFVLCLPVALPIRAMFGGAPPRLQDYVSTLVIAVGLAGFFLISGNPADPRPVTAAMSATLAVAALGGGVLIAALGWRLSEAARAVTLSAVSGVWFGVEAVLVNAVAAAFNRDSWEAFGTARGLVALIGAVVVGLSGFALSQVAFRAGNLATSFPAMLVIDPLVAVVLGAVVMHETVRSGPAPVAGYAICLLVIAAATLTLARSTDAEGPDDIPPMWVDAGESAAGRHNEDDDPRRTRQATP